MLTLGGIAKIFDANTFDLIREVNVDGDQIKFVVSFFSERWAVFDSSSRMIYIYEQNVLRDKACLSGIVDADFRLENIFEGFLFYNTSALKDFNLH